MKKFKKILALLLAAVMCMSMSMAAFAEETYSITITNDSAAMSIVGKTYTAHKLFDVTYSGTNYAYSINTSNPFYSTAGAKAVLDTYFDFTDTSDPAVKTVTVKTEKQDATSKTLSASDVRALADALNQYIPTTGGTSATATSESVTINLTEAGYYIVTGTVKPTDPANSTMEIVSAVILDNADPTATVKPKASVPTLDKKTTAVTDGGQVLDAAGKAAVAKVGTTVSYELDSVAPDLTGYTDYTFTFGDRITAGLDYVTNSFKLKVGTGTAATVTPTIAADGRSFTYTIPFNTLKTYTQGDAIVLPYDCVVNATALTTDFENNTAKLTYSHSPYDTTTNETPEKKTYIIDLNLDVDKIDGSTSDKRLDGAEFRLFREVTADGAAASTREYYHWDTTNNKVTWVTAEADADKFTTGTNGNLTQQVRGLDQGTYYLEETEAPKGYNRLKDPVEVVIVATESANGETVTYTATYGGKSATMTNGVVSLTDAQSSNKQPVATGKIENNAGVELPSTGGIGTTIFYVIGSILVIGAGIVLVTRRKMGAQ
jgi:fimbrial isopeptide formation D2 family protein/LPXTG-motif cell wall-anchored protein